MANEGENRTSSFEGVADSQVPFLGSLASSPSFVTNKNDIPSDALGRFDQYIVLKQLGGGAFGIVYLALDTVSNAKIAVKTLHPLLRDNADEMARMRANFAIVSRLHHSHMAPALVLHLVQEVESFPEGGKGGLRIAPGDPVLLMSYAPGETLYSWRQQFPSGIVPLPTALSICRQIADVLDYAHANKVVHRDIKPSNIIIENRDGEFFATVLDFGLAAEIRSSMGRVSSINGDVAGTRPYMAPEQWAGNKQDGRADQYALACLLYELLSGVVPFSTAFDSGDSLVMERAVAARMPEPIKGLSRNINDALLRALSKEPGGRYPSCRAFIDDASELSNGHKWSLLKFVKPFVAGVVLALILGIGINYSLSWFSRSDEVEQTEEGADKRHIRMRRIRETTEDAMDSATAMQTKAIAAGLHENPAVSELMKKAFQARLRAVTLHTRLKWEEAEQQYRESESLYRAAISTAPAPSKLAHNIDITKEGTRKSLFISPGVRLNMRWIPVSGVGYVRDSQGFWLGETEVTQAQWESLGMENDSEFRRSVYPVERVSLKDCYEFIARLNKQQDTFVFRLPTTNEWTIATMGEPYKNLGWLPFNSGESTHPVGYFANRFGVSDLFGNVYEWCSEAPNSKKIIPIGGSALNTNVLWRDFLPQKDRRIGLRLAGDLIEGM